jgi:formylglycine-generating enzyme required for sulfatase activity
MKMLLLTLGVLGLSGVYALAGGMSSVPSSPSPSTQSGRGTPSARGTRTPTTQPTARAVGETWTNEVGMKFAYIPAGEFLMGSPEKEIGRGDNETQHRVTLSKPFLLGVYEVTQGQWKAIMGSNPSFYASDDKLPVEEVSWTVANNFCRNLGNKDGLTYRLPTEAEWEYACRAGSTTPFHTGETISSDEANFNGKYAYGTGPNGVYREKTIAVGTFKPNAWGLFDMHGNVWEWCSDWLEDYPAGAATDPTGPIINSAPITQARVMRGGAFGYVAENCRSAVRGGVESKATSSSVGFRVALELR